MTPSSTTLRAATQRVAIFANPIAGRGTGAQIARRIESRLRKDGLQTHVFLQPPAQLADADLIQPARAAVIIGGDGTLRAVAERLIQADVMLPLLPVPLGTANLMGRHLGIRAKNQPDVEDRVARAIRAYKIIELDAGRANGRLMLLMAGIGYDAHVIHHLHQKRRGPIRFKDYLWPSLIALRDHTAASLRAWLDGREVFAGGPAQAFVGNLAEYGTGFPVVPHAAPDDGSLDLCVVPCRSRSELVRMFLMAAAGEHTQAEGVVYARGKHVRIDSPVPVPVQVDGDPAGHTPLEVDLLPVKLPFIVM